MTTYIDTYGMECPDAASSARIHTYLVSRGQGKVRVQDKCRMYSVQYCTVCTVLYVLYIQAKFAQHPPTPSLECTRAEACSPVPSLFSSPDAWDSTIHSRRGSFH
jgi:hypothetical protein